MTTPRIETAGELVEYGRREWGDVWEETDVPITTEGIWDDLHFDGDVELAMDDTEIEQAVSQLHKEYGS